MRKNIWIHNLKLVKQNLVILGQLDTSRHAFNLSYFDHASNIISWLTLTFIPCSKISKSLQLKNYKWYTCTHKKEKYNKNTNWKNIYISFMLNLITIHWPNLLDQKNPYQLKVSTYNKLDTSSNLTLKFIAKKVVFKLQNNATSKYEA